MWKLCLLIICLLYSELLNVCLFKHKKLENFILSECLESVYNVKPRHYLCIWKIWSFQCSSSFLKEFIYLNFLSDCFPKYRIYKYPLRERWRNIGWGFSQLSLVRAIILSYFVYWNHFQLVLTVWPSISSKAYSIFSFMTEPLIVRCTFITKCLKKHKKAYFCKSNESLMFDFSTYPCIYCTENLSRIYHIKCKNIWFFVKNLMPSFPEIHEEIVGDSNIFLSLSSFYT